MTAARPHGPSEEVPISASGIPIRNLWYMLMYAWNEVAIKNRWHIEVERAPTLDALLASILAVILRQRFRIGLGRDYINQNRMLKGVRGRIDFTASLKRLAFENGRAYCFFQEFSSNAPKNQIVRSTLLRMVQIGQFGPDAYQADELKQKLGRLVRDLDGIDLIELHASLIHWERLACNDDDYRLMLAICELILKRQMPTEEAGHGYLPGFDRDLLTLHQIYERFVANFYRARLQKWRVTRQKRFDWHATTSSVYLPAMRPDLMLEHKDSGHIVVLDTKFTPNSLISGRFSKLLFDSSHLYQLYSYLRSQEQMSVDYRYASGVLLYPTVRQHLSEELELQGHLIRFETVDLSQPWTEIEARLLEIVASLGSRADGR